MRKIYTFISFTLHSYFRCIISDFFFLAINECTVFKGFLEHHSTIAVNNRIVCSYATIRTIRVSQLTVRFYASDIREKFTQILM